MSHVQPEFQSEAFSCPHCNAYAHMLWSYLYAAEERAAKANIYQATCQRCSQPSIWLCTADAGSILAQRLANFAGTDTSEKPTGFMLHPISATAPMPSEDLPSECRPDYLEARDIASRSPRGAAALLRLTLQKLCIHLGLPGRNINDDIKALVRDRNLSEMVQQALDAIRVIGNNAVHPGELQLDDDQSAAVTLFELINIIVDEMITKPNKAKAMFDRLPQGAKEAIARRDQAQV